MRRLARVLFDAIPPSEGEIGADNPIAATDLSEPEPDLSVFPPGGAYRIHHPTQASLLIEVSNTSLRRDLTVKARIYARHRHGVLRPLRHPRSRSTSYRCSHDRPQSAGAGRIEVSSQCRNG
jgi:hypothetical protein